MLKYRIIIGPLMIAALLGLIYLDQRISYIDLGGTLAAETWHITHLPPGVVIFLLVMLLIIPAVFELRRIFAAKAVPCYPAIIIPVNIAIVAAIYLQTDAHSLVTIVIAGFIATLIWHIREKQVDGALAAGGAGLLTMTYLGFMPGMLLAFRSEHAAWEVFGIVMITKSCDIGAYFTGRMFGKHKLIPWLSPKKTVEGLVGGVVLSVLVAAGLYAAAKGGPAVTYHALQNGQWIERVSAYAWPLVVITGIVLALVGHAGDLMMSLFKRDAATKDSGDSIPGFGGVLDVVDSPLLIAPAAYWLLH